jgi:hypothetical protein
VRLVWQDNAVNGADRYGVIITVFLCLVLVSKRFPRMGEHIFFEEELFMTKGKKFFAGMAVLLSASLFFIGCETEVEVPGAAQDAEAIRIDVQVTTPAALAQVLADPADLSIGYQGSGNPETLTGIPTIPEGKTVSFFSKVTPDAAGLDIQGWVRVGPGGELVAAASTAEVSVTGKGRITVLDFGKLVTDVAGSVDNGTAGTTALGKTVTITGQLEIGAATLQDVTDAVGFVRNGATVSIEAALAPSEFNSFSVSGKNVLIDAKANEAGDTITVQKGVVIGFGGSYTSTSLAVLDVRGAFFHGSSAPLGGTTPVKITVADGAVASLATVGALAAQSEVASGGTLKATAISSMNSQTLLAKGGATVDDVTFPGSGTDTYTIANLTTAGVTVATLTVPTGGWTLTGPLVVSDTLTLTGDLTIGSGLVAGIPGMQGLYPASGSLALVGASGVTGAKTAGAGKIFVADTEIEGTWQAVDSSTSGLVTIALEGAHEASITGVSSVALTAKVAGAKITQNPKSAAGSNLTVADDTVIDFNTTGALVMKKATVDANKALITLGTSTGTTAVLKFGTGTGTNAATNIQLQTGLTTVFVTSGSGVTGAGSEATGSPGVLWQIKGAGSNSTLTGPANNQSDATIDDSIAITI